MKNVKRFIALLMAATLVFSLSVSVFAEAFSKTETYEYIVKVLDEEGNVVDSVATGDKIYIAAYFQKKGDSSTTIDLLANSSIQYNIDIPEKAFGNRADFVGYYEQTFNGTAGDSKLTDWVADTGCFTIWNTLTYSSATVINPQVCLAKHEIIAGDVGEYELLFYPDGTFATDPMFQAKAEFKGTTLTITEAQAPVVTPAFGTAVGDANAGLAAKVDGTGADFTYDNAYAITVSMENINAADEVGVKFIPTLVLEDSDWTAAAKAIYNTAGLGSGTSTFRAALINLPRFLKDGVEIQARAYMVVDGDEIEDLNIVTKTISWGITDEPTRD